MNTSNTPSAIAYSKVVTAFAYSFAVMLLLSSCHNSSSSKGDMAITGSGQFADTSLSTFNIYKDAQGRKVLRKNTNSYDVINFIDREDLKKMLVKVTKSETSFVDSDAAESRFVVNVVNINDPKSNWTKEMKGIDLDYTNKVIVAHTEGQGSDMEDTYTQYSLLNGEKLMTYTYGQLMALIPGTSHKRFFGYLSQQSATEDKPKDWATISYVGSDRVIDVISVKIKGKMKVAPYTPEIKMLVAENTANKVGNEGKTAILTMVNRDFKPSDIGNFAMQINFSVTGVAEPVTVLLPVRDDRVDLANAAYDKSVFELTKIN